MSRWNHLACDHCWWELMKARRKPGEIPFRVRDAPPERCCFCGLMTTSGIWLRFDPAKLSCRHPAEA